MNRTCETFLDEIDQIRSSTQELSDAAIEHLAVCPACTAEWNSHQPVLAFLEAARKPVHGAPVYTVDVTQRVVDELCKSQIAGCELPAPKLSGPASTSPWPVLAVAASLLFMVLVFGNYSPTSHQTQISESSHSAQGNEVVRVKESVELIVNDVRGGYREMATETVGLVEELVPPGIVSMFSSKQPTARPTEDLRETKQSPSLWNGSMQKAWELWKTVTDDENSSSS